MRLDRRSTLNGAPGQCLFNTCWSRLSNARANQAADTLSQCNEFPSNIYASLAVLLFCQSLGPFSRFLIAAVALLLHQLLTCGTCSCLRLVRNTLHLHFVVSAMLFCCVRPMLQLYRFRETVCCKLA